MQYPSLITTTFSCLSDLSLLLSSESVEVSVFVVHFLFLFPLIYLAQHWALVLRSLSPFPTYSLIPFTCSVVTTFRKVQF